MADIIETVRTWRNNVRWFLRDLREVQRTRQERQRWYRRHMKLRSMEFTENTTPYDCFVAARALAASDAELCWLYQTIRARAGRAKDRPGHPAPALADLIKLYEK